MITRHSGYIIAVVLAGGAVLLFRDHVVRFNKIIALLDAVGLGAYGVVGVQTALGAELSVAAAVLVGVINAVGGGLLRDVLVREEPLMFKPGQFYALAALLGCVVFVLIEERFDVSAESAALAATGATFVFRVLAIQFNWKTSPVGQESPIVRKPLDPPVSAPSPPPAVTTESSTSASPAKPEPARPGGQP